MQQANTQENSNDGNITLDMIKADAAHHLQLAETEEERKGMLIVRTGEQWMESAMNRPIPRMLFSEFWHQGELCILFAESGSGKSILAVQIADSISRGESIKGLKLEAPAQPVLYFDFELNEKMFEKRYSAEYTNHYAFDRHNFYRVEINPDAVLPEGLNFEEHLSASMDRALNENQSRILIIDNLTYLSNETEKARDALPLMKHLKALKSKYNLSILALAHTPKRSLSNPITRNDLQGSKMLYNFCDSVFAIGESASDKNVRYLKQIKPRNTELIYDAENVCVCQLLKTTNFLQFDFLCFGAERDHLRHFTDKERSELIEQVKALGAKGKTQREIAGELHLSTGVVHKYLKF